MRSSSVWRVLLVVGALALLAAAVPVGAAGANGAPVNGTYPLYAGQDILVGELIVSNDTENLSVTFNMTGDYCMTETHLQVGDLEEVQTKKGNPIPGQFEYSMDHDCVYEYTYPPIPLDGLAAGDPVDIAAHASVKAPIDSEMCEVWQIGDAEDTDPATDLMYNYADEFNWAGATSTAAGPGLSVVEPAFTDPFIVGTTPTSEFPYNSNSNRGYAIDFDVQWDGHLHFGGLLTVSWSPGQSAAEMKMVSPGFTPATFSQAGVAVAGMGYFLDTYPVYQDTAIADSLGTGTHTINFQHTKGDGTFWDYVLLERPCETEETAWSAGTDFPGKNWATYSTYTMPDAYADVVWTNKAGTVTGIHTVFSLFAGTAGAGYKDGSGTLVQTTPSGTITVEAACVKIDGSEVNWGGVVTGSDDAAKPIGTDIIGWAEDGLIDMIGSWADNYPGNPDPCSAAALNWTGGGTVNSGDLVVKN